MRGMLHLVKEDGDGVYDAVLFFNNSESEVEEELKDYLSDGYERKGTYSLTHIKGKDILPSFIE